MPLYITEAFLNLYKEVQQMKRLENRTYGAVELKTQINHSTLKGFFLSIMFFIVLGLAVSSLNELIVNVNSTINSKIPITVISSFDLEKSSSKGQNKVLRELPKGTSVDIGKNQNFIEDIDVPISSAAMLDVGIETDEFIRNIGKSIGIGVENGNENSNLFVKDDDWNNNSNEKNLDLTKEFVHQEFQKYPSMDYEKLKSLVKYPKDAKALNLSGTVHVAALISKSGKLIKSYIFSSTNSLFEKEALEAVQNYNDFSPAIHNERAVECWIIIPIKFKLQ